MNADDLRADRYRFLKALYDFSGDDEFKWTTMWELGSSLGFDRQRIQNISTYLQREGLIKFHALGGVIGITHHGIKEIEVALSKPSQPTHYFPASANITVGTMINSTIQQASPGASQYIRSADPRASELRELIKEITEAIQKIDLIQEDQRDLSAEIETIQSQLESSRPKTAIIGECLASARRILEGAASNTVAAGLIAKISGFLGI